MEPRTETSSTATATLSSDGDESAERDRESPSLSNRSHTAWTVVHRLQLERGVSSAAIASRGKVQQLTQLLASTRRDLDEALGVPDAAALAERLVHERSVVDAQIAALDPEKADADASGLASTGSCFYQCFTAYSRLVKLVQHAQLMDVGGPRDRITDTFALLKEDLARERGFVAGLLSLPDEGVSSLPSRAFADFVVCMHSQAAHIAALRDMQAGADQKELILAAVVPSASLKAVQAQLLRTFDVRGVRRALDRLDWWGMMCEHLDKMHEVQRRLHQEALASTDASSSQSASTAEIRQLVTRAARSIAGDHRGAPCAGAPHQEADGRERASSLSQLALELSETPAEALKSQLLAILHRRARQLSPPATPRGLLTTDTSEADREAGIVPAEWRIPLEDVAFLRQIGAGSNGTCYEARWRGSSTVCVKVSAGRASLGAWRAEVSHLPKLRHPNVIQLLGVIATRPTYCLVLEYCPGGDLSDVLQRPTPAGFVLRVSRGVASGMAYLHSRGILHRDLKSSNVLLDGAGVAKLIDFGTATRGGGTNSPSQGALTAEAGTFRWMAPEVINHEVYSRPADVFSFAMVVYELITREYPFADRAPIFAALAVGKLHARPTLPDGVPVAMDRTIRQCWHDDPACRPTFDALDAQLSQLDDALTADERAWLDEPHGHRVVTQGACNDAFGEQEVGDDEMAPAVKRAKPDGA